MVLHLILHPDILQGQFQEIKETIFDKYENILNFDQYIS